MTIESAPYYWLTCDGPACDARTPDVNAGDEYSAYADESAAHDMAMDRYWEVGGPDGDLCEDCKIDAEIRREEGVGVVTERTDHMIVKYHLDGCIDIRLDRRNLEAASGEALHGLQRALDRFAESIGLAEQWSDENWRPDPDDPPEVLARHERHASLVATERTDT